MAIVIPIWVSLQIAKQQSIDFETKNAGLLVDEVVQRADGIASQALTAIDRLTALRKGEPCSEAQISLMREIALGSSYLQTVGYISNNRLMCSALGRYKEGITVGPVDYKSKMGVDVRTSVFLPMVPKVKFVVMTKNGYAGFANSGFALDVSKDNRDLSLSVIDASTGKIIVNRGLLRPQWAEILTKDREMQFFDGQYIVAARRSSNFNVIAVAAVPSKYLTDHIRQFSTVLVPLGIFASSALIAALLFLVRQQRAMPAMIRSALRRNEFFMQYQPVIHLQSGHCVGAEALIRWKRSDGTLTRPDLFIPIAEEQGLIHRITERVFKLIEHDIPSVLHDYPSCHIAINLSLADVQSDRISNDLKGLLERTGLESHNIIVEATERGFIKTNRTNVIVSDIRKLGVSIAIDDFGTGYSSLSYLTELEIDYLKIDKSFIDTIGTNSATSSVVLHIIEMAKSLNLEIIAEGVETEQQAQFLLERGVQYAQGWLYGKPMSIQNLAHRLADDKNKTSAQSKATREGD